MTFDLKATLRDRGLRQKVVADRMGVSEATVSQWGAALATGAFRRIPAERARELADVIGVEPGFLRPDLWPRPEVAA